MPHPPIVKEVNENSPAPIGEADEDVIQNGDRSIGFGEFPVIERGTPREDVGDSGQSVRTSALSRSTDTPSRTPRICGNRFGATASLWRDLIA